MRLPEGFFRDLSVPDGAEAFQLPVRPAGVPGAGAPRVEALSLAEARSTTSRATRKACPCVCAARPWGLPRALSASVRRPRRGRRPRIRKRRSPSSRRGRRPRSGRPVCVRRARSRGRRDGAVAGAVVRRPSEAPRDGLRRSPAPRGEEPEGSFRPRVRSLAEATAVRSFRPRVSCDRFGCRDGVFFFEWRVGRRGVGRRRRRVRGGAIAAGAAAVGAAHRAPRLPPRFFHSKENPPWSSSGSRSPRFAGTSAIRPRSPP